MSPLLRCKNSSHADLQWAQVHVYQSLNSTSRYTCTTSNGRPPCRLCWRSCSKAATDTSKLNSSVTHCLRSSHLACVSSEYFALAPGPRTQDRRNGMHDSRLLFSHCVLYHVFELYYSWFRHACLMNRQSTKTGLYVSLLAKATSPDDIPGHSAI